MRVRILVSSALPLMLASACIETVSPPEPALQAKVPYGPKIFLRDGTIETASMVNHCTLIGTLSSTVGTTTITVGGSIVGDTTKAFNCYVSVKPGEITVDTVEATNELFQLCIDSEVCLGPKPSEQTKGEVCIDEDGFDRCPIVGPSQPEATKYCEFLGKRLPTGIESLVLRQPGRPQEPGAVTTYPTGNATPEGCAQAVLSTCDPTKTAMMSELNTGTERVQPLSRASDGTLTGAAPLDKTTQGVFDLTGNAAEWSSDLEPIMRGGAVGLPWFCYAPAPEVAGVPTCPSGEVCVFGTYRHASDGEIRERPLCLTEPDLAFSSGTVGSTFGGSFASPKAPSRAGAFVRNTRPFTVYGETEKKNGDVGIRCVDVPGKPSEGIEGVPQP